MTAVDVARRLPHSARYALAQRLESVADEQWTEEFVTAAIAAVVPGVSDDSVRALLAAHPHAPLLHVDGVPHPARTGALLTALDLLRTVERLEPEAHRDVPGLQLDDIPAITRMLDLTVGELEWFADHRQWLRHSAPPLRHYRVRRITKPSGGFRVIEAPKPRLAEAQRRILRRVLDPAAPHPAACGFRPGGSVLRYAQPHTGSRSVVRLDLRDCYSTVTVPRVRQVFRGLGYPRVVSGVLADLCTVSTPGDRLRGLDAWQAAVLRGRHLPQGAPTSPALMNLVLARMDARLAGLARAQGARYSRYGDDLAFSGASEPALLAAVVPRIIRSEGFTVNPRKTRVMRSGSRQELAGVVVNDRAQVRRRDYDDLRALLHNAARFGAGTQNRDDHPDFRAYVYGRIAWVGQGNERRRARLLAMAADVRW
ncbi:hypothetical protein GCM10027289_26450 [Tsukamurella serpentis]